MGEFVAADRQANAMSFSLGQLDVAEKFGIGYFFNFGDGMFGDKEYDISAFIAFGG